MKLKLNFGDEGLKGFLFSHVEKFVVAIVGLLVLWMVYSGWSSSSKMVLREDPSALKGQAEAARQNIDRDTWEKVMEANNIKPADYDRRVKTAAIDSSPYQTPMPWNPPLFPSRRKRSVPEVYEPLKLEVKAGYGALAVDPLHPANKNLSSLHGDAAIKEAKAAREKALAEAQKHDDPKAAPKPPKEAQPKPPQPAGPGKRPPRQPDPKKDQKKDDLQNLFGGGPKAGDRPGGVGADMIRGGVPGAPGFGPPAGFGPAMDPEMISFPADRTALAKGFYFISLTALVPIKKQWDSYEDTFKDAMDYDPTRDVPKYTYPIIERQEENGPWTAISRSETKQTTDQFIRAADEIADSRYVHPKLTAELPPLMMRDLRPFALHTEVPQAMVNQAAVEGDGEEKPGEGDMKPETPTDDLADDPAGDKKVGGLPGGPGIGAVRPGAVGRPVGPRGEGAGRVGPGMMNAPGMVNQGDRPSVDYLLLRFFDYNVEPGKKYRYRVKLRLEDPNNPPVPKAAGGVGGEAMVRGAPGAVPGGGPGQSVSKPRDLALDERVFAERKAREDEIKTNKRSPQEINYLKTKSYVESPFASVVTETKMLAGPLMTPKDKAGETMAKLVVIQWDHKLAVNVPVEVEVPRGATLNVSKDTYVIAPGADSAAAIKLDKYNLESNVVLLDFRGGDPLPGSDKKNPILSSGQMLLVDDKGQLVVRYELDDHEEFRRYVPDTPKEKGPGNPLGGPLPNALEGPGAPAALGRPGGEGGPVRPRK